MKERANDRWSRVSEDGHLQPIVGDFTIGFMHALPQVVVVFNESTIRKRAGRFFGMFVAFGFSKSYPAAVTESAVIVDWKLVFVNFRNDDRHPGENTNNVKPKTRDRSEY